MKINKFLVLAGGAVALYTAHYLGQVQGYVKGVCVTANAYIDKEEQEKKLKTEDPYSGSFIFFRR